LFVLTLKVRRKEVAVLLEAVKSQITPADVLAAALTCAEVEARLSDGFMLIRGFAARNVAAALTDFQPTVRRSLITSDCYPFAW